MYHSLQYRPSLCDVTEGDPVDCPGGTSLYPKYSGGWKQVGHKFKANLSYMMSLVGDQYGQQKTLSQDNNKVKIQNNLKKKSRKILVYISHCLMKLHVKSLKGAV